MPHPHIEKSVLITGATGAIGSAIVKEYAKHGYYVYIHYYSNKNKAQNLLEEINSYGEILGFDMKDKEAMKKALTDLEVDVLINNAGITRDALFFFMEEEAWDEVIETNLNAPFIITKLIAHNMIRRKKGSIVNIASISGVCGNAGQANYSASKGGMIAFSKTLAIELGRYNIRVNALAPGIINSEMTASLPQSKALKKSIPLGRFGEASEVAVCAYFIGDQATYISGEVLNISGGMVR